jgi:hypothetical protein
VDWRPLFEAAGLELSAFSPANPEWRARGDADQRFAWTGALPGVPNTNARVEAASQGGRPMFFSVIAPWTAPTRMASSVRVQRLSARLITLLAAVVGFALLAGAALLARRNLRSGRGDRRGAFRTGAIVFVCQALSGAIRARHFGDLNLEYFRIDSVVVLSLASGMIAWLSYIALEPYVRRFWPELLIGWTRLMSGRIRDPLVGRDFLIGTAAGMIAAFLISLLTVVPRLLHRDATALLPSSMLLLGSRYAIASALGVVMPAYNNAIQCLAVAVFLRILVKRPWLVFSLSMVLILPVAMNNIFTGENAALQMPIFLGGVAMMFIILLRFGLLALVVAFLTMHLWQVFPLTLTMGRPYAGTSIVLMLGIAALSGYGYYASRGDEPLFGKDLLEQS